MNVVVRLGIPQCCGDDTPAIHVHVQWKSGCYQCQLSRCMTLSGGAYLFFFFFKYNTWFYVFYQCFCAASHAGIGTAAGLSSFPETRTEDTVQWHSIIYHSPRGTGRLLCSENFRMRLHGVIERSSRALPTLLEGPGLRTQFTKTTVVPFGRPPCGL